jgi:hypothetical protein
MVNLGTMAQPDAVGLQEYVVIRGCHIDVPSLDESTVLGEDCRELPAAAQQIR